jgi:hypothetical protein
MVFLSQIRRLGPRMSCLYEAAQRNRVSGAISSPYAFSLYKARQQLPQEPAREGDCPAWLAPGVYAGYLFSLNVARHPCLAPIVLRSFWRPASLRSARRSNKHPALRPPKLITRLRRQAGCSSTEVKRSEASHEGEEYPFAGAILAKSTPQPGAGPYKSSSASAALRTSGFVVALFVPRPASTASRSATAWSRSSLKIT